MTTGALWVPRSSCGPGCLPPAVSVPRATRRRTTARMVALTTVVIVAGFALAVSRPLAPTLRSSLVRAISRAMLAALGVRHECSSPLPTRRALVVAHHVSWLDALVILAHLPARLLAKRQVRGWPVVGALAAAAGTLFIDRSRPRELPTAVARIAAALRSGAVVAAFPEGTTWCGRTTGRFRPAVFQAAVDADVPVTPLSLRFRLADGSGTTVAAFLGEDTLFASIARVAATDGLGVTLRAHPALHPTPESTRRDLARIAQIAVSEWHPPPCDPIRSTRWRRPAFGTIGTLLGYGRRPCRSTQRYPHD